MCLRKKASPAKSPEREVKSVNCSLLHFGLGPNGSYVSLSSLPDPPRRHNLSSETNGNISLHLHPTTWHLHSTAERMTRQLRDGGQISPAVRAQAILWPLSAGEFALWCCQRTCSIKTQHRHAKVMQFLDATEVVGRKPSATIACIMQGVRFALRPCDGPCQLGLP